MIENAIELLKENAPKVFDFLLPGVQNKLMEKKIKKAKQLIETINKGLKDYGLRVDYERYFEEKLAVPLEAVRTASGIETEEQRGLLQNLFMRHLAGQYENDGYYVSFIRMIKEMTREDIETLMKIRSGISTNWRTDEVNHLFHFGLVDVYHDVEALSIGEDDHVIIDGGDVNGIGEVNLMKERVMQAGAPYLTSLGRLFLESCTNPF